MSDVALVSYFSQCSRAGVSQNFQFLLQPEFFRMKLYYYSYINCIGFLYNCSCLFLSLKLKSSFQTYLNCVIIDDDFRWEHFETFYWFEHFVVKVEERYKVKNQPKNVREANNYRDQTYQIDSLHWTWKNNKLI